MSLASRVLSRLMKLPPAETHRLTITRDLKAPMRDGVILLGDHYAPADEQRRPTVLVRSPYGRAGVWGIVYGRAFAERGFQVFIQSVRGTFGSGGTFDAFRQEHDDGLDTVAWIRQQPWFTGELFSIGASYLGLTQWSVAPYSDAFKAIAPQITASDFSRPQHPGGAFSYQDILSWSHMMSIQERRFRLGTLLSRPAKRLNAAYATLPIKDADVAALGKRIPFYGPLLEHTPGDEWWRPAENSPHIGDVTVPINLVGGWYDIFLPWQLDDYRLLREAGRDPSLAIGPWTHGQPASIGPMLREALKLFKAQAPGAKIAEGRPPVRIYVMGANEWRDLDAWPPTPRRTERWHLQPGSGLAPVVPADSEPDHYRYDPADPTPTVGGPVLGATAGAKDNRVIEARADVLVYSSAPLTEDLEVIGPVSAEIYLRSSIEHTDVFVRLCDVSPDGKSINICDGILRLTPDAPSAEADGVRCARVVRFWATAHRFLRGHRLRVQVSSGAFPRFSRNTGSGEPLATATTLVPADQTIYHDAAHPSAILLPVM